jgi:hypothetical protein
MAPNNRDIFIARIKVSTHRNLQRPIEPWILEIAEQKTTGELYEDRMKAEYEAKHGPSEPVMLKPLHDPSLYGRIKAAWKELTR